MIHLSCHEKGFYVFQVQILQVFQRAKSCEALFT